MTNCTAFNTLLTDERRGEEADRTLVQTSACRLVQILRVAREAVVRSVDAECAVVFASPAYSSRGFHEVARVLQTGCACLGVFLRVVARHALDAPPGAVRTGAAVGRTDSALARVAE